MNVQTLTEAAISHPTAEAQTLTQVLLKEMHEHLEAFHHKPVAISSRIQAVVNRITLEVERICAKSSRIQTSGDIRTWELSLARHRLQKCLAYYELGAKRGRVELHSTISAIVYRYIAPAQSQLSFQARYNLIEDFLQEYYAEALKAFRREHELQPDYSPHSQIELAEYMAFTEQYAKRRINLPNGTSQQLIVLRAQAFAKRQPAETTLDIEQAIEFPKGEEAEAQSRSSVAQQLRSQLLTIAVDPAEAVLRDRVLSQLITYLESQDQSDCINYLVLKMQDLAAPEIDEILGLTARERDYLQQRFKYHVEKFACTSHWQLVHQWLGADLDQKLGLSAQQWQVFVTKISSEHQQMLQLKKANKTDEEIGKILKLTAKQLQKRWTELLAMAWKYRNQGA